jgi:methylenetetrahydrofolate reductase (NADPH)
VNPKESMRRRPRTLSFEVMPPRKPELAPRFWDTVNRLLTVEPDFLSVTYGAAGKDRSTARSVVRRLVRDTPIQPIAHITCVGTSRAEVADVISDYLDAGVRTFLALRGDPPSNDPAWRPPIGGVASATELVTLIRALENRRNQTNPGWALRAAFKPLTIAVAAFPAGNPAARTTPEQEAERLLVKQAAGANFAITQLFYNADVYGRFLELARSYGVTIPIVAGILPPTDPRRLSRTAELTAVEPPQDLMKLFERADSADDIYRIGISYGISLVHNVLSMGAPGVHLYTFNQASPALDLVTATSDLTPQA